MGEGSSWWENIGGYRDDEIERINALERSLGELSEEARRLRRLITCLEMCHHKAKRRVAHLLEAIGAGRTDKGPRFPKGEPLRREQVRWRALADVLELWVTEVPQEDALDELPHHAADARDFYRRLGERTPLRAWQVERLRLRILDHVFPLVRYESIEWGSPDSEFRRQTCAQRLATGDLPGAKTDFSLAAAIDNTVPCNWNFENNLRLVLSTIGGNGESAGFPLYAAHGCNLQFNPLRAEMTGLVAALEEYVAGASAAPLVAPLGEATPLRRWLAASLAKTIRVQMSIEPREE